MFVMGGGTKENGEKYQGFVLLKNVLYSLM